jgi:hypothetical protein
MSNAMGESMGWLRIGVGVGLIVAPRWFIRLSSREAPTGVSVLLLRTIGIRDLVVGSGTVSAARNGTDTELSRWTSIGMASDSMDVVASLASWRAIGRIESAGAALAALVFAVGDASVLRSIKGNEPAGDRAGGQSSADGDHRSGTAV